MDNIQEQQKILREAEEARLLRLDGMKLREEYHHIIDEYINKHDDISQELEDILNRGVYCGAGLKKGGILFTSINPSYPPYDGKPEDELPANFLKECQGAKHWQPYVDIAETFPDKNVGYIDLFPIRESSQTSFEKVVPTELKSELLRLTMKKIWESEPYIIIHTNKKSEFYWGTVEKHPWMGYKLLPIEDERLSAKGTLYQIIGVTGTPESIMLDEIDCSRMNGCFLFLTSFNRPWKETKEEFEPKRLNADDVHYLWEKAMLYHKIEKLRGYLKVSDNLEEAISIMRMAKTEEDCKKALEQELGLTTLQANSVFSLSLSELTVLDSERIKAEIAEKKKLLS